MRLLELFLWCVGLLCAFSLAVGVVDAKSAMRTARGFTGRGGAAAQVSTGANPPAGTAAAADAMNEGLGKVIGRLEIAKIGLSVPVLDNYDPDTLKRGVGHIPGTALPGGLGNLGLAGHRDTYLRAVRNIKVGMEADVVTADGRFRYSVDSYEIVTPDQVDVLDIRGQPEMTLITCYPFDFIGAAPKRFVVHAHLLSLEPS